MTLFLMGVAIGFVLAIAVMWNRNCSLEDELMDKTRLLDTAVTMLREERGKRKEAKCGSGDLFEKF